MVLIVSGAVVPIVALLSCLRLSVGSARRASPRRDAGDVRPGSVSRWEGLAQEMVRRGDRGRPRRSDAETRRRHLAAVLPADARR